MVCRSLLIKKIVLCFVLVFNAYSLEKIGTGLLTFTIFSFEIYELDLYTDKKIKSFKELKDVDSYKMVFKFKKDIDKKHLKTAWSESKDVFPAKGKGTFFKTLEESQPDMKDGDQIVINAKGKDVEFVFPGKKVKFSDLEFKKHVPWIWLGDNEVGEELSPQIFKTES